MAKLANKGLNSKAAINRINVESLPYSIYNGSNADIVPFGLDNLYPHRVIQAVKKSPTALGCIKRQSEFIFGQGDLTHGNTVVNREGETLNDILTQCIRHGYSQLGGYCLHFNFNALGQICEIFFINSEYVRKHKSLDKVDYGLWNPDRNSFLTTDFITIDIYGKSSPLKGFEKFGFDKYKGQVYYYSRDFEIYPTSPLDSAVISASYEKEAQIYPYANIRNGFSGTTIIKMPTMQQGEQADSEADKVTENLEKLHGADKAGSSLVMPVPLGASGEMKPFQMVEHLTPSNIDGLFTNQNLKAESDILKVYNMPKILLGVSDQGMFNEASFNDAFNYKNSDTEIDRQAIEREFNKFMPKSIFGIDKVILEPLKMKGESFSIGSIEKSKIDEEVVIDEDSSPISPEQREAQANLKGSVGCVQGILSIQEKVSSGIADYDTGINILMLIYGFTEDEAVSLLGDRPNKS